MTNGHEPRPARNGGLIAGAVFAAVVGLIVAAFIYTRSVNDSVDQGIDQRTVARVAACVSYNVDVVKLRTAIKDSLLALVPPGAPLTAEQQARVASYDATVDARLAFRDCSPAGIEAFYSNPPPDPAVP